MVPRTIENTREPDLTVLTGKTDEDEEVIIDEAGDEMPRTLGRSPSLKSSSPLPKTPLPLAPFFLFLMFLFPFVCDI